MIPQGPQKRCNNPELSERVQEIQGAKSLERSGLQLRCHLNPEPIYSQPHFISWSNQWMQVYKAQAWAWECFRLLLYQLNTPPLPSSKRTGLLPQPSFLDCYSGWCGHGSRRNGDPPRSLSCICTSYGYHCAMPHLCDHCRQP